MASEDSPLGLDLPVPDDAAIRHSTRLLKVIVERIEQRGGVIGFDEYMQMALYEPGLPVGKIALPRRQMPAGSMMFGGVGAARWSPDAGFEAAADPRRAGGTAIAHRA